MIRSGFIALVFGLLGNHFAFADLILNGSFESPGFSHSSNADNYRYLADVGDTSITGWTITRAQTVGEQVYWYHSSRYPTFDGEYALELTDAGKASTFVAVEANQQYSLRFYANLNLAPPLLSDFALNINIGAISTTLFPSAATDTGIAGFNGQNWLKYEFTFTPTTAGTQQFELFNVADGISSRGNITIDAVSITAVPEPSSCVTVLLAGIMLVARNVRRRTKRCTQVAGRPRI